MTLNRRSMLAAMAATFTAAAAPQAATQPTTDPELTSLADTLKDALQDYLQARDNVQAIAAEWGPQWPTPDPEIVHYGGGSKTHRDILGRGIETPWGGSTFLKVQDLGTPEVFEAGYERHMAIAAHKGKTKSKRGMKSELLWAERCKARIEPARAYWAEVDRITAASGIEAAQAAETAALSCLTDTVGAILNYDTTTATGLVIKAEALTAWGNAPAFNQGLNPNASKWMAGIAATIAGVSSDG